MIDRKNSPSPWSQTINKIHNPTPNSSKKLMSSQDESYVPRKRNNSLIPVELINDSSEGGRERAALATVFGVPEYIDSKVFWERQQKQTSPDSKYGYVSVNSISVSTRPISSSSYQEETGDYFSSQKMQSKFFISSYVDSVLDPVGLNVDPSSIGTPGSSNLPIIPTPTKSFSLPRIPAVSKFTDLLIEDENGTDIMLPANPSSVLIHPSIRAESSISSSIPSELIPQIEDTASLKSHVAVVVGTPEVFDLLLSDEDERFIIWGPDPILLSSSMATATSVERPSSYATLYNNQFRRPELKGFSSNTTSTLTRPGSSSRRWSERFTTNKADHGSILLKKAFGLSKKKPNKQIHQEINSDVPKVIEAATIHKLIEKLTNTLDYTLMTDFFLTYRDFLNSQDLCQLLISRFYWALQNDDESRKIVRIRTFVVLRHWLNNYFVHDFIGNRELRIILTNFLNHLPQHPLVKNSPRDQRIVKILKRVVRRLKKLYYNQSSEASRVKVILPPPPTAEQEQMSEIVRNKLSNGGIIRKRQQQHHGNLAVQDARNVPVVVVGTMTCMVESGVDRMDDMGSSIHNRYDKNVYSSNMHDEQTSSVVSMASDDSLESELSAGDTLPYNSHISEDQHGEENSDWVKEQQETLEFFKQASPMIVVDQQSGSKPPELSDLTSDYSSPSSPTTPNNSGINTSKYIQQTSIDQLYKPDDDYQQTQQQQPLESIPVVTGLSKQLSEKSIERRKSEKNLQQSIDTKNEIPKVPNVPSTVVTKKPSLKRTKSNSKKEPVIAPFAAIRYESTQVMDSISEKQDTHHPNKHRLSKVLSKVFHKSHESSPVSEAPAIIVDETTVTTTTNEPKEEGPKKAQNSSQLVSMIAQRLRNDSVLEDNHCDCAKCSSNAHSTSTCRRLSRVLLGDPERRHSFELRRKRGASTDNLNTRPTPQNGPIYLGHLEARSMVNDLHSDDDDDDDHSSQTEEKSIQTEAQASSSRANNRMSVLSEVSSAYHPRSRLIELGIPSPRPMSLPIRKNEPRCFIMMYRTSRIAKQFCFIERDVLSKVGWEELIHCKWTKMDPSGNVAADNSNSQLAMNGNEVPNVLSYTLELEKKRQEEQGVEQVIQRFNIVCQWVSSEIVRTRNMNERVRLIEKFIRLAKKCKLFSNYATLVQILLGLQSPAVARLEKTWSKVSPKCQKLLNKLTEFTSPTKNWKNIRDSMTEVAEEYGHSPSEVQVELPGTSSTGKFKKKTIKIPFGGCIPFLGIYLSDLVFNSEKPRYLKPTLEHQKIYMANNTRNLPACLDEPLVNFRKHRVIATVIKRVLTFQSLATRYAFEEDFVLKEKCKYLQVLDAAQIREYSASLE